MRPARRDFFTHVRSKIVSSERHVCTLIGHPRLTQRRRIKTREDEVALTAAITQLARKYGAMAIAGLPNAPNVRLVHQL